MLFRNNIDPRCAYCERGSDIGGGEVVCVKRGVVPEGYQCRHFVYDPFKRAPVSPKLPDFSRLEDEDFTL
ncbi:MAG: hypothetical protein IJ751_05660 [Oscillospiraceae bacterium]|nr:hypothetical protein [Oscillospiraceae bacterium]